jgi:2-succinyl-6-hydroxy-2,4-cyclohexadiene-1-carboxylate synthase
MLNLVCLHGFWGDPSDFQPFIEAVQPKNIWVPDLSVKGPLDSSHSFGRWSDHFASAVKEKFGTEKVTLVGYSQGGRLALHALMKAPKLFSQALLVSTHPGQLPLFERPARVEWTQKWIDRFRYLPLQEVEADWNAQDVFQGSKAAPKRNVAANLLVQALANWSVLNHEFDWDDLRAVKTPLIWAFGALDHKYLAVKTEIERQGGSGSFKVIAKAGHRLLEDAPSALAQLL